jgi:hypothetical protein
VLALGVPAAGTGLVVPASGEISTGAVGEPLGAGMAGRRAIGAEALVFMALSPALAARSAGAAWDCSAFAPAAALAGGALSAV